MIFVSLRDFAATGAFGPIRLGMKRNEVQGLLGVPELWGTEKRCDVAAIWRYSEIEFYFSDEVLYMIFTDHDSLTEGGNTCNVDPWIIRPRLPRDEFQATLRAGNIEFSVSRPAYDSRQRVVLTSGNVQFHFLEEPDPDFPDAKLGLFSWCQRVTPNRTVY